MIARFITTYGPTVLYTILTGLITWIGSCAKKIIDKIVNEKIIDKAVSDAVEYVEQVFKDIHGDAKRVEAENAASEMLAAKGIKITPLEMRVRIESTVSKRNKEADKNAQKEPAA